MGKKILDNINMGMTWTSYISSMDGVLRSAGFWNDEIYKLMGMTGMAFHFLISKKVCPSSVTVYNWIEEHLNSMDRIGFYSEVFYLYNDPRLNTLKKMQENSIQKIKESIDRGIGVTIWAPTPILEFGIINGYDDSDKVFFVKSCVPDDKPDPLIYSNLGKSDVPCLFYQIVKEKIEVDPQKIYRDSLDFAVSEWKKEFHYSPFYASGRKSYDNLIESLEKDDFYDFGLMYILNVYCDSKYCIVKYLEHLLKSDCEIKGLEEAVNIYQQVSKEYQKLIEIVPWLGPNVDYNSNKLIDRKKVPDLISIIKETKNLEEKAMQIIEKSLEN